jgi:hypothetical protein
MNYISDEEIAARPEDSEEAFVVLERIARGRYENDLRDLDHDESAVLCQKRYMMSVLPLISYLQIDELSSWERPDQENWQTYDAFMTDVGYAVMTLRLRTIDRTALHSVAFDSAAKEKLRHLLGKMRETIDEHRFLRLAAI